MTNRYRSLITAIACLAGVGATSGAARAQMQGQAALRQACRDDYQQLCSDVQPGGGRILACLRSHAAGLSPRCWYALSKAASMDAPERESGALAHSDPRVGGI